MTNIAIPKEPWHFDKRVPIAWLVGLAIQTATAIWFIAALDGRVGVLERDLERQRLVDTTQTQSIRRLENGAAATTQKIQNILEIVLRTDRRLERMEGK